MHADIVRHLHKMIWKNLLQWDKNAESGESDHWQQTITQDADSDADRDGRNGHQIQKEV